MLAGETLPSAIKAVPPDLSLLFAMTAYLATPDLASQCVQIFFFLLKCSDIQTASFFSFKINSSVFLMFHKKLLNQG